MRACWLLPVVSGVGLFGCSFDGKVVIDDDGRERVTWTLDTADDFRRPGAVLDGAGIEAWGSLSSGAYVYGAAFVRAVDSPLWMREMTDPQLRWDAIDTATVVGRSLFRASDLAEFNSHVGLYVTGDDSSLAVEGELFLADRAPHTFALQCDDVCFLEIAAPGSADFTRVAASRQPGTGTGTYTPTAAGWQRFRVGFANTGGNAQLRMSDTTEPLVRGRLRVRADELRGLQRQLFDQQLLTAINSYAALETLPILARLDFDAEPSHIPPYNDNPVRFSARWAGQVYIAVAGTYALRVRSDNGNRLQLGAMRGEAHWTRDDPEPNAETIVTTALEVGWTPLVIDYTQGTGGASIAVDVVSSPDPELPPGAVIPVERLRPVEAASRLLIAPPDRTVRPVQDGNTTGVTSAMPVTGIPGEVPLSAELQINAENPRFADMRFELVRPDGATTALTPTGAVNGANQLSFQLTAAQLGAVVGGSWGVRASDPIGGGGNGELTATLLTLHTAGGPPLFVPNGSWTSEIVDLGNRPLVDVPSVTWEGRRDVAVDLRACAQPTCDGEDWIEAESGKPVVVVADRRYLQVRVRLHSAGTYESALDRLEIVYRRPGPT